MSSPATFEIQTAEARLLVASPCERRVHEVNKPKYQDSFARSRRREVTYDFAPNGPSCPGRGYFEARTRAKVRSLKRGTSIPRFNVKLIIVPRRGRLVALHVDVEESCRSRERERESATTSAIAFSSLFSCRALTRSSYAPSRFASHD